MSPLRQFSPIPKPDFEQKCHYTQLVHECGCRHFLKKPRIVHVWPCKTPRGKNHACPNMAYCSKEVYIEGMCSKCQPVLNLIPVEVITVATTSADWGVDGVEQADGKSAITGSNPLQTTKGLGKETDRNANQEKQKALHEAISSNIEQQSQRNISVPTISDDHAEFEVISIARPSSVNSWVEISSPSKDNEVTKCLEDPEWELIGEEELTQQSSENGNPKIQQCRVN